MPVYRPIPQTDLARPDHALSLVGTLCWFETVEVLERGRAPLILPVSDLPSDAVVRLTSPRPFLAGKVPLVMGILNVTPDSFSDGGRFFTPEAALAQARALQAAGADILDIGGESTRPGAQPVPMAEETARTAPVIASLRQAGFALPISIDTRKAAVARAALAAGAAMVNDVAALTHDPALAAVVAAAGVPVCLMHARGDPETMQVDPRYDDVVLDVFDFLSDRIKLAEAAGIARARIIVDPGIGFGKTLAHNLALIARLSAFHDLGCAVLLGASRKRFIGVVSGQMQADTRLPGSLAVALAGAAQGAHILRVHDVAETKAALALWRAPLAGDV